jgi:hypothetical protein
MEIVDAVNAARVNANAKGNGFFPHEWKKKLGSKRTPVSAFSPPPKSQQMQLLSFCPFPSFFAPSSFAPIHMNEYGDTCTANNFCSRFLRWLSNSTLHSGHAQFP